MFTVDGVCNCRFCAELYFLEAEEDEDKEDDGHVKKEKNIKQLTKRKAIESFFRKNFMNFVLKLCLSIH